VAIYATLGKQVKDINIEIQQMAKDIKASPGGGGDNSSGRYVHGHWVYHNNVERYLTPEESESFIDVYIDNFYPKLTHMDLTTGREHVHTPANPLYTLPEFISTKEIDLYITPGNHTVKVVNRLELSEQPWMAPILPQLQAIVDKYNTYAAQCITMADELIIQIGLLDSLDDIKALLAKHHITFQFVNS
jgi:hypothetical protein